MTAVEESSKLSEAGRLSGVFFNPKRAFTDIVARPRWFVPIILLVAVRLCLVVLFSQHVGFDRMFEKALDKSSRAQNMSAEQRAQTLRMMGKFAPVTYVTPLIAVPAALLVTAAVLMLIVNATFSRKLAFDQMAAITTYSFLPQIITGILAILVLYIKDPDDYDLENPLGFNIGAYLNDETTPKWLLSLASSFDLFSFWTIALLATGIVVASRKPAWGKAFFAVIAPWLLIVVVKAGWAALFS